ncbi:MAG: cell division protein ZapA [Christensenellales bacterium]|jgi:cell division protein ZapA
MQKIRTTVKIAGKEYTISSYDDEAYVQRVATYVDRRMEELNAATRLPSAQLAVLTAMNVTDDMLKAHDEIRRLRAEISQAREEIEALKKEVGR